MTTNPSSSLVATPNGRSGFSLAPQSLDEALRFADILSKSSIVPKDYQGSAGNILVAIQWGAELGLPPLQAMQNIAVINGRPAIWGDAVIALVRASGLLEGITEDIADSGATCTVKRRGEVAVARTFTTEDAKRAGLLGKQGPWQQYPKRMLQMRARAWALRDVFPDVLRGVHVGEEAQDLPSEPKHMGPADEVKPAEPAKPAARGDRARAALARQQQPPALPAPSLAQVLSAISTAPTLEALQEAAAVAGTLETDTDKAAARQAYRDRKASMQQAQQTTVDADSGEILGQTEGDTSEHDDFVSDMEAAERTEGGK